MDDEQERNRPTEFHDDSIVNSLGKRAKKFELLTREQERELIARHQAGDKKATAILYDHNIGLVKKMAMKQAGRGLDLEDLIQESSLGFLHTLNKFDLSKPFKLSTYAHWWMRQYTSRSVSNKSRLIRIPIHQYALKVKVQRFFHEFVTEKGRRPLAQEIAEGTGIDVKTVERIRFTCIEDMRSLDESVGEDDDGLTKIDLEMADVSCEPEYRVEDSSDRAEVRKALELLTSEEKELVMYRYGFLDNGEKTDIDTARFFGIPPAEAKLKLKNAIIKLREAIDRSKLNADFLVGLTIHGYGNESVPMQKSISDCAYVMKEFLEMTEHQIYVVKTSRLPVCIPKVLEKDDPEKYETALPPGKLKIDDAEFIKGLFEEVGAKVSLMR